MMPNIQSAKKRVLVIRKKTLQNQMVKTGLKTTLKKFEAVLTTGNAEQAAASYRLAVKKLDQAVSKGVMHRNTAARKKSQLTRKLAKVGA